MEKETEIKENKMGVMPVNKLLVTMALPIVVSMLVQAFYNIVDSLYVSRADPSGVASAAVNLAFTAQNFMIAVGTGTGVGINALVSRALGEKNNRLANKIAENGVFLAFCSYIVFLILGLTVVKPYYSVMNNDPAVVSAGVDYLTVCLCCSFGIYTELVFERLMMATGKTIYTMYSQGIGAIINIVLDPVFIFKKGEGIFGIGVFGLGAKGAAIATVLGQIISGIVAVLLHTFKNREVRTSFKGFRPSGSEIKKIYAIGVPSIIMASIGSVMYSGVNLILKSFKGIVTAAQNVFGFYFKLQSFVFMPVFGLNNGLIPIVSYNYGAGNRKRILKTVKFGCLYATIIMAAGTLAFQLIPDKLLGLFGEAVDLSIGVPALRIIGLCFLFAGFGIVLSSVFQSFGHGFMSMMVSIARQLLILLPVAYLMSLTGNVRNVWLAFPIAELVSMAVSLMFYAKLYKKEIRNIPDGND